MAIVTWQQIEQQVRKNWEMELPGIRATLTGLLTKDGVHSHAFKERLAAQSPTIQELVRAVSCMGNNGHYAIAWQLLEEKFDQIWKSVQAFAHMPGGLTPAEEPFGRDRLQRNLARLLVNSNGQLLDQTADKLAIANLSDELICYITAQVWQVLHPKRELKSGIQPGIKKPGP